MPTSPSEPPCVCRRSTAAHRDDGQGIDRQAAAPAGWPVYAVGWQEDPDDGRRDHGTRAWIGWCCPSPTKCRMAQARRMAIRVAVAARPPVRFCLGGSTTPLPFAGRRGDPRVLTILAAVAEATRRRSSECSSCAPVSATRRRRMAAHWPHQWQLVHLGRHWHDPEYEALWYPDDQRSAGSSDARRRHRLIRDGSDSRRSLARPARRRVAATRSTWPPIPIALAARARWTRPLDRCPTAWPDTDDDLPGARRARAAWRGG
jgi:hypothetical protein